jgi:nucleoside-diphosphate-sugar epimerase
LSGPAPPAGYVFTESDRNIWAENLIQTGIDHLPEESVGYAVYSASKLASDDAMWHFFQEKKPSFSMTSIHPAVVMGPAPTFPESPDELAEGLKPLYKVWAGISKEMPPPIGTSSYVDVRDVAEMHLWAALNPQTPNGQRYIASAGYGPAQAFADILRERYPDDRKIVEGTPGKGYSTGTDYCARPTRIWYPPERPQLCGRKIVEHMGIEYRVLSESVIDTIEEWEKVYHRE